MTLSFPTPPTTAELAQTGPLQQRSLSLPSSRIVLNPQDFTSDTTEVEQNCDATLPLGLGYYAFDKAIAIPRLLSFWSLGSPGAGAVAPTVVEPTVWAPDAVTRLEREGRSLVLTLADEAPTDVASASAALPIDPRTPVLRLAVRDVVGQWTLRLEGGGEPIPLMHGSAVSGLHHVDLREHLTGPEPVEWRLTLGVVGRGGRVELDELLLVPALDATEHGALDYTTDWSPAGLGMTGHIAGAWFDGGDAFVGSDSLVRELRFDRPPSSESALTLVGRHLGRPVYDPETRTVVSVSDGLCLAIAVPEADSIRFYADESELLAGGPGTVDPVHRIGVWAIELRRGSSLYRVGCGLDPEDAARAAELAGAAARTSEEERRAHWSEHWDALLARLPQPASFTLSGVDVHGLGASAVRAAYFRAYVGLWSNVLPPQPEVGYDYPTVATGKGSMWNHGALGARSAAAWETFLAIQYLAYADPGLGWACFTGLMSRVDADGSLGGESLPSRKAQTASVLYALTGDRGALAESYPGLRRLLLWQAARPRWIYGTYDFPGEQDAEFLTSLLIDLRFGAELAEILGLPGDARELERVRRRLAAEYARNCFAGPDREAVQHWFPDDESATLRGGRRGFGLQVAAGLAVPGIEDWQRDALLARFDAQFDPDDQLAGFDFVKHPNVGHTVAGLLAHGRAADAEVLVNAVARDVIRSGSFAEVYDRGPDGPKPWGVRPSVFGMTQVIEAVWLHNGLRMDLGAPQPVQLPGASGGVGGLRVRGSVVAIGTEVESGAFEGHRTVEA